MPGVVSSIVNLWINLKKQKKAYYSFAILSLFLIFSCFLKLICNEDPLLLMYKSKIYVPLWEDYGWASFTEDFDIDYKEEKFGTIVNSEGWVLWSPIAFSPHTIDWTLEGPAPGPPSSKHLLGTDDKGRDIFVRLIFGLRTSLFLSLASALLGIILACLLGGVQATQASYQDLFFQRLLEILASIPQLFILMLLGSLFQNSFMTLLIYVSFFSWISYSKYLRAEILKVRHLDFIQYSRLMGASKTYMLLHHVFPNSLTSLLSFFPKHMSAIIGNLAVLNFLGLGLRSSIPTLGELILLGKDHLDCWWILASSLSVLFSLILILYTISEGLRKGLNPYSGKHSI